MFTGLIESVGRVAGLSPSGAGVSLIIESDLASSVLTGDSLAVNGVCLTVVDVGKDRIWTDVSPETLRVTSLGAVTSGSTVNLERPLRADGRFGGHFVLGHVDGTGTIRGIVKEGEFRRVTIEFPETLAPYLVPKGSIAMDGISLTIAFLRDRDFDVQIVPFTWDHTSLHASNVGDPVNLECDVIGKYVVRSLELAGLSEPKPSGVYPP